MMTGNQIAAQDQRKKLLTPLTELLTSHELAAHREKIGFEFEVTASKARPFGWDQIAQPVKDRLMLDWMDKLQDYPLHEIQAAIDIRIGARVGVMPTEVCIRAQIQKARAAKLKFLPPAPEPEPEARERISAQCREEIIREVGLEDPDLINALMGGE